MGFVFVPEVVSQSVSQSVVGGGSTEEGRDSSYLREDLNRRVALPNHLLHRLPHPFKPTPHSRASSTHLDVPFPIFLIPHAQRPRQFPHDRIRNDPSDLLHRDGRDRFRRRGVQPRGTLQVGDGAAEVAVRSLDQGFEGLCWVRARSMWSAFDRSPFDPLWSIRDV